MTEEGSPSAIARIVAFVLEIDKLKGVTRKTKPIGLDRYENPAEHSWQIALLASSLAAYAPRTVDVDRVIRMLLVHDLGEIDTGDTIFYAEEGLAERKAAERIAVQRIVGLLPASEAAALMLLWEEFEDAATPEARFAHAADRAMPVLLNLANDGQSWRENGIGHARVVERIAGPIRDGCPALWRHLEGRLEDARREGWFAPG